MSINKTEIRSGHIPDRVSSDWNRDNTVSHLESPRESGLPLTKTSYDRSELFEVENCVPDQHIIRPRQQSEIQGEKSNRHAQKDTEEIHKYCQYCGNDIEKGQVLHKECSSCHLPRCKRAANEFRAISAAENVLLIGIDVTYLYGQKKADKGNKEKRGAKIKELLNKASALHNSDSGFILIHLVGLADGDNSTVAFDEFADVKLNSLINDGSSFDEVYKKQLLNTYGKSLIGYKDILALYVKGSKYLVTSDVKTKTALDDCIIDTTEQSLFKLLESKRQIEETHHNISLNKPEDLSLLQESRNVQTKAYFQPKDGDDKVVKSVFDHLKFAEYITAFTKLETGGSYLLGIAEEQCDFERYVSKKLTVKPVKILNCKEVKDSVKAVLHEKVLVCDYDGNVLRGHMDNDESKDLINVSFIPALSLDPRTEANANRYVIHMSARPVNGIVFYDIKGPVAYRVGAKKEDFISISRFTVQQWFQAFTRKMFRSTQSSQTAPTERKIIEEEKEFHLGSMDLLPSPLKQIGNSIYEIKTHYMFEGKISIIPGMRTQHLGQIRDCLLQHLENESFLYKLNILTRSLLTDDFDSPGFVVLMDSLALAMDFEISSKPSDVQCDILLAICGQPVIILTLVDEPNDSDNVTMYNSSVAKGVSSNLRKFMDETVNVVFGVLCTRDIEDPVTFQKSLQTIARNSSFFVPFSTLTTNPTKYEKIVTAFWAGVAETKSVISKDGRLDSDYLRFLTKDQCIILLENINKKEVEVQFQAGTGATTLMVEVARRLAKLDDTLLLCRSQEEKERLRKVYEHTCTPDDLNSMDLSHFLHLVDESGKIHLKPCGRYWKFTPGEESGEKENVMDTSMAKRETPVVGKLTLKHNLDIEKVGIDINEHSIVQLIKQCTSCKEEEFFLGSMHLLRPPLKQMGNSIDDLMSHYRCEDHSIIPFMCPPHLVSIRDYLQRHLEGDFFLYKTNIVTGLPLDSQSDKVIRLSCVTVLMDSLALAIDFDISPRPKDILCDVLLTICGQPVIVLTLVHGDKDHESVLMYNSSVAKGVSSNLRKFMDESVNVVFGVLPTRDIEDPFTFQMSLQTIARNSSFFVPFSTLTTNPTKYEKIVTAFWAGVAETKSVISKDGRLDSDYLRFLTKDQCIILLENINKKEVEVQFQAGTGATTLMVEVARRLAKLDDTLLLCRSQEEKERLSSMFPNTKTPADLEMNYLSKYTNIVDETGEVVGHDQCKLWRFVKSDSDTEHLQHRVNILEKQNAYTEKMINLFSFSDRVDKLAHLSRELETLKLIDISSHGLLSVFHLPSNVALEFIPVKHSPSAEGSRDRCLEIEEYMHHVMDQLKVGIKGRSDLFPLLGSMIKQVKGIIPGLQDKVQYFEEETERRTETERKNIKDIHSMDHRKKRRETDQRLKNEGHKHKAWNQLKSNIKRMKVQVKGIMAGLKTKGGVSRTHSTKQEKKTDISVSHDVPGMKHNKLSEETGGKHEVVIAQSFVQDAGGNSEAEVSISADVFDSEVTEELKERFKTLEKEAYRRQQELNGLTEATGYGVEWEYNMDNLSEEMSFLRIQDVVIDVIGEDEIPVSSTKQTKSASPYESDDDSRFERRDVKRAYVYQLRHLQHGTLKQSDILGIVRQIITDDHHRLSSLRTRNDQLEHVYGGPVYTIGEIESERSGPVSCPAMTLHKDRVYELHDVSEDGHELTNTRKSGRGHHSDQFKKYEGTCSGLIPLPSSPSTLTVPTYWETNTRIQGSEVPWWPLLEMGVMEERQVDMDFWVYKQTRGWCVRVVYCLKHHDYCTQVWGERRPWGECLTDTLTQTPGTDVMLKYGVVVDIGRGRLAFIDLNRERVLYRFDVVFRDSLRPMFSVRPYWLRDADATMRLVSGSEVVMDDKKQKLIAKALFGRV